MNYKEYRKFYKSLCDFFKKKFPLLALEQIEDVVSEVIALYFAMGDERNLMFPNQGFVEWVYAKSRDRLRYQAKKIIKFPKLTYVNQNLNLVSSLILNLRLI